MDICTAIQIIEKNSPKNEFLKLFKGFLKHHSFVSSERHIDEFYRHLIERTDEILVFPPTQPAKKTQYNVLNAIEKIASVEEIKNVISPLYLQVIETITKAKANGAYPVSSTTPIPWGHRVKPSEDKVSHADIVNESLDNHNMIKNDVIDIEELTDEDAEKALLQLCHVKFDDISTQDKPNNNINPNIITNDDDTILSTLLDNNNIFKETLYELKVQNRELKKELESLKSRTTIVNANRDVMAYIFNDLKRLLKDIVNDCISDANLKKITEGHVKRQYDLYDNLLSSQHSSKADVCAKPEKKTRLAPVV